MPKDILIVDDNEDVLASLAAMVKMGLEIEPFACSNSSDAFAVLRRNELKVLLLDYQLGSEDMSGVDFLRMVRNELRLRTPCILLTGFPQEASQALFRAKIANLGMVRFLGKPSEVQTILSSLADAIQSYQSMPALQPAIRVERVLAKNALPL